MPSADVVHHSARQDLRLPAEPSHGGIEWLCHQLAATCEQKKTTAINRIGRRAEQRTIFATVQRRVIESIVRRPGGIVVNGQIEEMLTIGQKIRPAVRGVLRGVDL